MIRLAQLGVLLPLLAWAAHPDLEQAKRLYECTEYGTSLKLLQALPEKDAAVWALTGRNYYMLADFKKATDALEKAVAAAPADSEYALWLARAYGRRAETSNPLTAPAHASKAHRYFEKAVELDPKNLEAMNDLFEYYLEAPGFLGGGFDKAQALASRIAQINAAEGYWAQAKLAEKRKELGPAEANLRRAAAAAPRQIGKLIELAKLLTREGRYQEAEKTVDAAQQIAPDSPRVMFAKADLYIKSGAHLDVARQLLQRYLASALTPDDPPRADALKLLRQASGA
jgi:cytochrome c-type biogenesis protein CcmH/NrfG